MAEFNQDEVLSGKVSATYVKQLRKFNWCKLQNNLGQMSK